MASMADHLRIRQTGTSPATFTSTQLPQRMGHGHPVAYGGCTMGIAVHAACKTVTLNDLHIYSILGAFHGPTRFDRALRATVTPTRDTKTFATRRVVASQTQDDGSDRTCCDVFVDFHVLEPAMVEYSAPPARQAHYGTGPLDPATTASIPQLVAANMVTAAQASAHNETFALATALWDTRHVLDSISAQNLMGLAKSNPTTQDSLPMPSKTSAEWVRTRDALPTESENMAAMGFIMDAGVSFLPLLHDHKNYDDAGPCSTLDFAVRVLRPGIDMRQWHLREGVVVGAAVGRTYGESRLWDQWRNLVAVASQSGILRPPVTAKSKM